MRRVGVGVVDEDVEDVDDEHDDRLHLLPVATRLLRDDEANTEDDEASADAIRAMMKIITTTTKKKKKKKALPDELQQAKPRAAAEPREGQGPPPSQGLSRPPSSTPSSGSWRTAPEVEAASLAPEPRGPSPTASLEAARTPGGRPKTASELRSLREEVQTLKNELQRQQTARPEPAARGAEVDRIESPAFPGGGVPPPGSAFQGLPPELLGEQAVRDMHVEHARDMLKMQYELERLQRQAEMQQLQNRIKGQPPAALAPYPVSAGAPDPPQHPWGQAPPAPWGAPPAQAAGPPPPWAMAPPPWAGQPPGGGWPPPPPPDWGQAPAWAGAPSGPAGQPAAQAGGGAAKMGSPAGAPAPPGWSGGEPSPGSDFVSPSPAYAPSVAGKSVAFSDAGSLPASAVQSEKLGGDTLLQDPNELSAIAAGSESEYESEYDSDDEARPMVTADNNIGVLISKLGPTQIEGQLKIVASLYEGDEPVQNSKGENMKVTSSVMESKTIYSGGVYHILNCRERLNFRGVPLTASTTVLIEISRQNRKKYGMGDQGDAVEVVAWTSFAVIENGSVLSRLQGIPIYRPPVLLSAVRKMALESSLLDVFISTSKIIPGVVDTEHIAERLATQDFLAVKAAEDIKGVPAEAWMRVARAVPPTEPFQPGESFVLRIDAARLLPSNVTITKITGMFYTSKELRVGPTVQCLAQLDSLTHAPIFRHRETISTADWEDPFISLVLTMETLEAGSEDLKVVGYATFPMFVNPVTGADVEPREKDFVLHKGAFQLPLHISMPHRESRDELFTSKLCREEPRLPCSSLLIRVLEPHFEETICLSGDPLPEYSNRDYDSQYSEPTEVEVILYSMRLQERLFIPARETLKSLIQLPGGEKIEDRQLFEWANQELTRPDLKNDVPLDYDASMSYIEALGFSVAIDGALHLMRPLPSFAFHSLNPPGTFYNGSRLTEDVNFARFQKIESHLAAPVWTDGFVGYPDTPYDPLLVLVIDIRALVVSTGLTVPVGWTALNVFKKGRRAVDSAYHHLPLFQGTPTPPLLLKFAKSPVDEVLESAIKTHMVRLTSEPSSVLLRVLDGQRGGQMPKPATHDAVAYRLRYPTYLTEKDMEAMHKNSNSGKTLGRLKPKRLEEDEWLLSLRQKAAKSTSVVHFPDLHMSDLEDSEESDEDGEAGGAGEGAGVEGQYDEEYDEDYDEDDSYVD